MYIFRIRADGKNFKILSDTLENAIAAFRRQNPGPVIQSVEGDPDLVIVDNKP